VISPELATRRDAMERLHQQGVPWWRFCQGSALMERAEELGSAGDLRAMELVLQRVDAWMERQQGIQVSATQRAEAKPRSAMPAKIAWPPEVERRELDGLESRLRRHALFVPRRELRELDAKVAELRQGADPAASAPSRGEQIRQLRVRLIQRLQRSYAALAGSQRLGRVLRQKSAPVVPGGMGPYNTRHNLEETLATVASTDPIWAADFVAHYQRLFRLQEALDPRNDKKK